MDFVILHTAKFIEPVILVFMWAEIPVELQSSHLNIPNKELRVFHNESYNVEQTKIYSDCFFLTVMAVVRNTALHNTIDYVTTT